MRFWKDESGQALVLAILFMTLLLAFMALAVDVGILFRARRNVQAAADATAVAAALDYKYNQNLTTAQNAGVAASTANGFTNGTNGVVVNISRLTTGIYASCGGCFEATVKVPNPTFFMSLFNVSSIDVGARATAGHGTWENCMILLGTSGADFNNSGSGTISMPTCGFVDDSNSTNAMSNSGALTMTARSIGVVGGTHNTGAQTLSPTPVTGITPSGDPLGLGAQSTAGCGAALSFPSAVTTTVNPGCYQGLSVTGAATLTFSPGLYVIHGPLKLTGAANLSGTGVTFYFDGTVQLNGATTMRFSAPTSGTWNGILFFESPADTNMFQLTGASSSNLKGIIYVPNATVDLTGASSMQLSASFVVKQLKNTGAINLTLNDYLSVNPNSPLATVTLLE